MTVRVTADHFPGNNGIEEVAFNYNSLSKPFLKIFKWEIDGVNPVVISQLNETFWFSRSLRSMAVLLSRAQERRSREIRARSARERAAKPREK